MKNSYVDFLRLMRLRNLMFVLVADERIMTLLAVYL